MKILDDVHMSRYSIDPASTKMYHDLREQFWWIRMKCETARYVLEGDTCKKVKADYMKLGELLQPLSILDWKWEDISMDFIMGLPLTTYKFDLIWVIVINSPNPPTSYSYTPTTMLRDTLRSTLLASFVRIES
jgi:hypothetical protein